MKWNVFYNRIGSNKITTFNIFDHSKFAEDTEKNLKNIKDKNEFAKALQKDLFYYFWCKSEYKVIISSSPTYIKIEELDRLNKEREYYRKEYNRDPKMISTNLETEIKVDIYTQVMNDFGIFLDYVWNSKSDNNPVIQWIPVEEKLPENGQDVLCCRYDQMQEVYTYYGHYWEDSYGYWVTTEDSGIIAWMPLLKPYVEK